MNNERLDQAAAGGHGTARQAHLALLHGSMLLSGFGTVFLGPLLPALSANAHATDSGSGLFFTAQFVGAFFGGVTTSRRLWFSLLRGSGAAVIGFLLLSFCTSRHMSLLWTAAALLPLGFGVGQMLTSVNLLAARRFAAHLGSGLALVNFGWSLGAVLAPFVLGSLLPTIAPGYLLLCAACIFLLAFAGAAVNARFGSPESVSTRGQSTTGTGVKPQVFLYFAALLLLYGGVETSLSGWVTTFGTRYGSGALQSSAFGEAALWIGLTAGRALTSLLLQKVRERTLLTASLATASLLTIALSLSHGGHTIAALAALLGLSLAPWFPLVLAGMLGEGAAAGQVGTIIAVSGIGAAALPLLVGAVSKASGSLRIAMLVPLLGLLTLLALSFRKAQGTSSAEPVKGV
ncbi:MAG: MFS transporter [Janthinobacterium lividum]